MRDAWEQSTKTRAVKGIQDVADRIGRVAQTLLLAELTEEAHAVQQLAWQEGLGAQAKRTRELAGELSETSSKLTTRAAKIEQAKVNWPAGAM